MGVLLDSSVIIQAERLGQTETEMLFGIQKIVGDQEIALSVIVLTELLHAIYRAKSDAVRERRSEFIEQLTSDVPVYPYTREIADRAGRVGGQQAARGTTIPFADLLIGATALTLDYSILTVNLRHFRMIPDLQIVPF